jgi:hypothetical protein
MSKFASRADYWEAVAKRFARSLVDAMSATKDHEIAEATGLSGLECQRIARDRADAMATVGTTGRCSFERVAIAATEKHLDRRAS